MKVDRFNTKNNNDPYSIIKFRKEHHQKLGILMELSFSLNQMLKFLKVGVKLQQMYLHKNILEKLVLQNI